MKNKNTLYVIEWIVLVACLFSAVVLGVYRIDPYFHFHKPDTDKYYYTLVCDELMINFQKRY